MDGMSSDEKCLMLFLRQEQHESIKKAQALVGYEAVARGKHCELKNYYYAEENSSKRVFRMVDILLGKVGVTNEEDDNLWCRE